MRTRDRGYAIMAVLGLTFLLLSLFTYAMTRSNAGLKAVKAEYWQEVAANLAESGVEVQKSLLLEGKASPQDSPYMMALGEFGGLEGSFTSCSAQLAPGRVRVFSEGALADEWGAPQVMVLVEAQLSRTPAGEWEVIEWAEKNPVQDFFSEARRQAVLERERQAQAKWDSAPPSVFTPLPPR